MLSPAVARSKRLSRRAALVACSVLATAGGCTLTTSLDGLSSPSPPDAGRAETTLEAATADASTVDPCAESTLLACFSFETDTSTRPDAGAVTNNVDLVDNARGRVARFSQERRSSIRMGGGASWNGPALTLEAWVAPDRLPDAGGRFGLVDAEQRASMFLYPDGRVHCRIGNVVEAVTPQIPLGTFTHVACVVDRDGISAYANGVFADRLTIDYQPGTDDQPTFIGANAPNGGDHLEGLLDDVRVHRVALDAGEIARHAR